MARKEKTLPGKLQMKNEFILHDSNLFLNSSQKMQRPKEILNNNKYQYFIEDIYKDEQKDDVRKNCGNYQLNISSKPFGKNKKYTKDRISLTTNTNSLNGININLKNSQEIKPRKAYNEIEIKNNFKLKNNTNNKINTINNYQSEKGNKKILD